MSAGVVTYEDRLSRDIGWALREGGLHFEKRNAVLRTMETVFRRLDDLGVPYALAGDLAMFHHGYRRFTEVVSLLVTRESLGTIHERLERSGYVPTAQGSRYLRDAETGVRIEFLVTGDYPGDGKPKPVALPDPTDAATEVGGVRCLTVPALIQLKLAAGRLKELGDVQELIRRLDLPEGFADKLDPSVAAQYRTLWHDLRAAPPDEM